MIYTDYQAFFDYHEPNGFLDVKYWENPLSSVKNTYWRFSKDACYDITTDVSAAGRRVSFQMTDFIGNVEHYPGKIICIDCTVYAVDTNIMRMQLTRPNTVSTEYDYMYDMNMGEDKHFQLSLVQDLVLDHETHMKFASFMRNITVLIEKHEVLNTK